MATRFGFLPRRSYRELAVVIALVAVGLSAAATAAVPEDLGTVLGQAEGLADRHRYREVVELLGAVDRVGLDAESELRLRLTLARAYFHLGRYGDAYGLLGDGVVGLEGSSDAAVYLEASAYLTGRTAVARAVLEQVLAAGQVDLYREVTLPGERGFLGDPEVWEVLTRNARRLVVPIAGQRDGLQLGSTREAVSTAVPARLDRLDEGRRLGLDAGPHRVLTLDLGGAERLEGLVIDAGALLRYTPLRLDLGGGLGWWTAPDEAVERLGAPAEFRPLSLGGVRMEWAVEGGRVALEFGPPGAARPSPIDDGRAMLLRVELWSTVRPPTP